jgi:ribosomal protein S18 acetylase RimI-like enzyme
MNIIELKVDFVKVNKENPENCTDFMNLGCEYMKEVDNRNTSEEIQMKFLRSILARQGENNRWLILLRKNDVAIGFVHAKIDQDEQVGWGYILEFYIAPAFRRKGFGSMLYDFIKNEFIRSGAKHIWLNANKENGEPFWSSLGFIETGEVAAGQKNLAISI